MAFKYKTTYYYIYFYTFLTIIQFIYAIPIMFDYLYLYPKLAPLAVVPSALHLLGFLFMKVSYSEFGTSTLHIIGMLLILTNMIPFLNFIPNLIIFIYMSIKIISLKKYLKDSLTDEEKENDDFDFYM